mgnify:CR=1 FL=1
MGDLAAVEARIWSLLEPYRGELEEATIYGLPSLRWPGSGGHDYFAALSAASPEQASLDYWVALASWRAAQAW